MATLHTFTESASALQDYLSGLADDPQDDSVSRAAAALKDPAVTVCFGITRDVPAVIGECFGQKPGDSYDLGKTVALLRQIGADRVYDIDSLMKVVLDENIAQATSRRASGKDLPLITTKCPAVVHFIESHYPEYRRLMSAAPDIKQLFVRECTKEMLSLGYSRDSLCLILISACILDKNDDMSGIDLCLTIPEAAGLFKSLLPSDADSIEVWKEMKGGNCDTFSVKTMRRHIRRNILTDSQDNAREQEFGLSILTVSSLTALQNLLRVTGGEIPADILRCRGCIDGCVAGAGAVPLPKDDHYQAMVEARNALLSTGE